ncbi:hypothetical protein MYRA21_0095 [Myroides sp. A21]|uniref:hypothetical protein n=1 Tax=Myroides sp. A21 TaxID=1583100 RepID=UPI00057EE587|nr:hypothetical protein [Myroides sp. A21]AJA67339.1 hypothetical protein MYRA21_0095 [Myroides sp. A21]
MEATKQQKFRIRKNCGFDIGIKEELVQWATSDNNKTSLNDLSYEQAQRILSVQEGGRKYVDGNKEQKTENWGLFDKDNSKHKYILSLLRQLRLTVEVKGRDVADINKLSKWLKSERSPVQKPLKKMSSIELSKVIGALEGMMKKRYK